MSGEETTARAREVGLFVRKVALITVVLVVGCSFAPGSSGSTSTQPTSSAVPSASASVGASAKPAPLPLTFRVSAQQARMVATLIAFLDAYNAGRVDATLALLTDDVSISDCDHRAVRVITASGEDEARQWLRERAADRDQLVLESVRNENPEPGTGSHVVGVSYTRRTSDTLRSLGFRDGIVPPSATKVIFTMADDRIRAFANCPFGGSAETVAAICRPGGAATPPPTSTIFGPCDAMSPVIAYPAIGDPPTTYGVRVGPVAFVGFDAGERTAIVRIDPAHPAPTKFVLRTEEPLNVTLSGHECESGAALELRYDLPRDVSGVLLIQKAAPIALPGYAMFDRPGLWVVEARSGADLVGWAGFQVVAIMH